MQRCTPWRARQSTRGSWSRQPCRRSSTLRSLQTTQQYGIPGPGQNSSLEWVPGHHNIEGNVRADKLAKAACRQATIPTQVQKTTISHLRRTSVEGMTSKAHSRCIGTPPRGQSGIANHLPPRRKPYAHFTATSRELFGRLTQVRTGHAFTGEYYRRMNIREESESCPCGAALQTREHILLECPRYTRHRGKVLEQCPNGDLKELLGSPEGIGHLGPFLLLSRAFTKDGEPTPPERPPRPEPP
jgi:hypothetical protein